MDRKGSVRALMPPRKTKKYDPDVWGPPPPPLQSSSSAGVSCGAGGKDSHGDSSTTTTANSHCSAFQLRFANRTEMVSKGGANAQLGVAASRGPPARGERVGEAGYRDFSPVAGDAPRGASAPLDEPTTSLPPLRRRRIMSDLSGLEKGKKGRPLCIRTPQELQVTMTQRLSSTSPAAPAESTADEKTSVRCLLAPSAALAAGESRGGGEIEKLVRSPARHGLDRSSYTLLPLSLVPPSTVCPSTAPSSATPGCSPLHRPSTTTASTRSDSPTNPIPQPRLTTPPKASATASKLAPRRSGSRDGPPRQAARLTNVNSTAAAPQAVEAALPTKAGVTTAAALRKASLPPPPAHQQQPKKKRASPTPSQDAEANGSTTAKKGYQPYTLHSYQVLMSDVASRKLGGLGPSDTDAQRIARERRQRAQAYAKEAEKVARAALAGIGGSVAADGLSEEVVVPISPVSSSSKGRRNRHKQQRGCRATARASSSSSSSFSSSASDASVTRTDTSSCSTSSRSSLRRNKRPAKKVRRGRPAEPKSLRTPATATTLPPAQRSSATGAPQDDQASPSPPMNDTAAAHGGPKMKRSTASIAPPPPQSPGSSTVPFAVAAASRKSIAQARRRRQRALAYAQDVSQQQQEQLQLKLEAQAERKKEVEDGSDNASRRVLGEGVCRDEDEEHARRLQHLIDLEARHSQKKVAVDAIRRILRA